MPDDALTRLADRIAIEDLVTDYATARDTTDPELYRKIFDEQAQIRLPDGRILSQGLQAIVAKVDLDIARSNPGRAVDPGSWSTLRHLVTNVRVDLAGDSAVVRYYVLTLAHDQEGATPALVSFGRNTDVCVRRGERWLIARSTMAYDWGSDRMARALQLGPYSPSASS